MTVPTPGSWIKPESKTASETTPPAETGKNSKKSRSNSSKARSSRGDSATTERTPRKPRQRKSETKATEPKHEFSVAVFVFGVEIKCVICGYVPDSPEDAERHTKTAGKPKFERKPHLTQRPFSRHPDLENLKKELEKHEKPKIVKRKTPAKKAQKINANYGKKGTAQ